MELLARANQLREAARIAEIERRAEGQVVPGDFQGIVIGTWVKLNPDGTGRCKYKDKTYTTNPLGSTSIRANSKVELFYSDGVYYSNW